MGRKAKTKGIVTVTLDACKWTVRAKALTATNGHISRRYAPTRAMPVGTANEPIRKREVCFGLPVEGGLSFANSSYYCDCHTIYAPIA